MGSQILKLKIDGLQEEQNTHGKYIFADNSEDNGTWGNLASRLGVFLSHAKVIMLRIPS